MRGQSLLRTTLGLLTIVGLSGTPTPVWAQREGPNSAHLSPPKAVAVRAGRLFDSKSGTLLANQVVLIEGEKIADVGPAGKVQIPPGAQVLDLSRATVLPGLIDQHLHVMDEAYARHPGTIGWGNAAYKAPALYDDPGGWTIRERVLMALIDAQKNLLAGFTTILDMGSAGGLYGTVELRDAINKGLVMGPRMKVAGPRITEIGIKIVSPDAARQAVRELAKNGVDHVKLSNTGKYTLKPDGTMETVSVYPLEITQAIVDEAHKNGLKVSSHAYGGEGLRIALEAGVDLPQHGPALEDSHVKLLLEKGLPLSSTIFDMRLNAKEEMGKFGNSRFGMMEKAWKKAFAAGVKQGFSSGAQADSTGFAHGSQGEMFAYFVKWGMTPAQALRMATTTNAELIGWQDRVGTVEKGKFADLIGVSGNPLTDITEMQRVKFVMKGGQVVRKDLGQVSSTNSAAHR
jgi:imidazolonepropionase-like amidohydrolase